MEYNTHEEIVTRKAEIKSMLDQPDENLDVKALKEEIRALNEKDEELRKAAQEKQELRDMVSAGEIGETVKEKIVEDKKMEDRVYGIESMEYRAAWLKNLAGQKMTEVEERAYATTDAHHAIPTLVANKFFEKMKKIAPMLNEITLMRVAGNLKFVTEGTRAAATAKHTENSSQDPSEDTVVSVTLGAFEFLKVIQISKAALNQNIDQFEDWLTEMLSGDIARAIDNFIINDASHGIAAITFTTGTNQILNTAATGYTYANICSLIALLPAGYDSEAKFLTSKATLYGKIATIVDSTGQPIFVRNTEAGMAGMLMGYPVITDDYVATTNAGIYLGKWTDVVGNLSEGVEVERDDHAAFAAAAVMFRGYAAFDSMPAKTDAIVRLVNTAS